MIERKRERELESDRAYDYDGSCVFILGAYWAMMPNELMLMPMPMPLLLTMSVFVHLKCVLWKFAEAVG